MKRTKLLGLALVVTMASFTACTNDAEEVLAQEREIRLTSEITPSRVADPELQSTHIVSGRQVGVTITGATTDHNNVAWSVGNNGALTNTGDAVYYGNGTATITAYHPFNDDWDESTTYAFSVSKDQTDNTNYLNSDLLWTKATSSKTETAIPLTFSHKLAKINVTLVPEKSGDDLNGATISIYNTKISTKFNPTTGVISAATGEPQEIIAGVTADDVYTASAIVIPQEVSGKFIKITHENKTYYYTLASAKELVSGHSYSYTLTVKGKQLISTESSIDEWDDTEDEGDAEEEIMDAKSATLTSAGTLSTLISEEEKHKITSLTISGPINGDDIAYLRTIIPNSGNSGKGKVVHLDLSNASIVEGDSPYLSTYKTENNIIGDEMFSGCQLQTLVLPSNITTIKSSAFSGCNNLKALIIPNGVTTLAGNTIFVGVNTSLTIPKSVTEILASAFVDNDLTSIVVEEGNTKYDSRNGCNAVIETSTNTLVGGCKETIIPNTVTKIGTWAFAGCDMTTITIPSTITAIEAYGFTSCRELKTIHCKATNPPAIDNTVFDGFTNCTLYVPTGSKNAYSTHDYWKVFTNIVEE